MSDEARKAFEAWISAPPFEKPINRYTKDPALPGWPGCYRDYCVQLAWEAWQEAWSRNGEGNG